MADNFTYQDTISSSTENLSSWWHQFDDERLDELVNMALENNYDLNIAMEKINEFRSLYCIKEAELFPEVDLLSETSRTRFSKSLSQLPLFDEGATFGFLKFGFDAFWEVDIWGRIWRERNARFFEYKAQIEQMRDVYLMVLADVARAYVSICAINRLIKLQQAIVSNQQRLVELQTSLFKAGLASDIAVARQEQELDTAEIELKNLETQVAQLSNQLAVLLGMSPEALKIPMRATVPLSQAELGVGVPSDILRRRPDIRQAEQQFAAAHERVGQAVAEMWPSFNLFGDIFTESSSGKRWFTRDSATWTLGQFVRWPVLDFGRRQARVDAQKSIKCQADLAYQQAVINALKEVEDFLVQLVNSKQQLVINEGKVEAATKQERLTQDKYRSGLVSNIVYLTSDNNRLQRERELTQIQQRVSTSLIGLYKALGGGW